MRLTESIYKYIKEELDTWVDPKSKQNGWKVKILDVQPSEVINRTTATVELFDDNGKSHGTESMYIQDHDVKIGKTYPCYIDGIMAMPSFSSSVPTIPDDELPPYGKPIPKERYMSSNKKKITESAQGLARVIWGKDVIADEEHMGEDYELFSIICSNIDEAEDEYNDGEISKKEFFDKIKTQCREGQLTDEETKSVIDFYEKSYSDSPEDMSDEDSFTMYNPDYDKEVKVWKQDGKWYDDEGNRYMGYLSKQDVKFYFKGNWREIS